MSYYYLLFRHLISHYHVPNTVLGNGLDPGAFSALTLSDEYKQLDSIPTGRSIVGLASGDSLTLLTDCYV